MVYLRANTFKPTRAPTAPLNEVNLGVDFPEPP